MLLELDSQARELGIAVPALEDDEFAGDFAISPSDEPQSAVRTAADLDCLLSLATVSGNPGYCKPAFVVDAPSSSSEKLTRSAWAYRMHTLVAAHIEEPSEFLSFD